MKSNNLLDQLMNKQLKIVSAPIFVALIVIFSWFNVSGQATLENLDYWYKINNGFAKCADIGQSSGEASWQRDNFEVDDMTHKRGFVYAYIEYNGQSSDTAGNPLVDWNGMSCGPGMFRYATITDKWTKVAGEYPTAYGSRKFVTNRNEIFAFSLEYTKICTVEKKCKMWIQ